MSPGHLHSQPCLFYNDYLCHWCHRILRTQGWYWFLFLGILMIQAVYYILVSQLMGGLPAMAQLPSLCVFVTAYSPSSTPGLLLKIVGTWEKWGWVIGVNEDRLRETQLVNWTAATLDHCEINVQKWNTLGQGSSNLGENWTAWNNQLICSTWVHYIMLLSNIRSG